MDSFWRTLLWKQFGGSIDTLDNALVACPSSLWRESVWENPRGRVEFWYVAYHALFWLDLYLFGSEEGFAPPAPFTLDELDPTGVVPERPYTRDEVRSYLAYTRDKCRTAIATMTDERARQQVNFPWVRDGEVVSYYELQLYNMRHIQEHAAQLSLMLGHHGVPDEQLDWVAWARDDLGDG
jgi:hypothetical protein